MILPVSGSILPNMGMEMAPSKEADQRWEEAFASSQEALSRLADEALAEHRAGRTKRLNVDEL